MKLTREIIVIEKQLYEVLRTIRESSRPVVDVWKEHLGADKVFKREGNLFFCRLIEEAQIIDDDSTNESTDSSSERT